MSKINRYITTTLPYVNGNPHLGHALEFVQADTLARAWRAQGDEVFFTMGTDEHGQKIFEAAQKARQEIHEYVDHFSGEMEKLHGSLALSNNAFIRTTEPRHYAAAQEMWRRADAAGDIYKKTYTGLYCPGCEAFKTEKELSEKKDNKQHCLIHPHLQLEEITEENYFFALSRYQGALLEYLKRPASIIPEWRRQEAIQFVEQGLEDTSISRDKARLSWGIPVPGDDSQVMYVWFDALTNYISTLGWPKDPAGDFEKFWEQGSTLQLAGKDQVRFQSILWQGMLMSAGIKNTDTVFYHGFINSGGQKMSKSLGNVISPYELVAKYGTDATRYLLLRHVHPVDDSDITWERLDEWYTANLVNGLGNLVARVMKLSETHLQEPIAKDSPGSDHEGTSELADFLAEFEFMKAMDFIWKKIQETDERITRDEPFKVIKEDAEKGKEIIRELVHDVAQVAQDLGPFMPHTSDSILEAVRTNTKPENLFPRLAP